MSWPGAAGLLSNTRSRTRAAAAVLGAAVFWERDGGSAVRVDRRQTTFAFLNLGHAYDHLFILLYPTVVLALEDVFRASYGELLALSVYGFVAFGAGTLPAGWLGDRWNRRGMMIVFFVGLGLAAILTGLARSTVDIALGLTLVGLFASIYHPVGIAMVAEADPARVGKALGVNGVFGNLGVALAGVTAGALTDLISWRAAFIVPGIVAVATGLAYALSTAGAGERHPARSGLPAPGIAPGKLRRIFVVLVLVTLCGGAIFNATTISLPKVFDDRLSGLAETTAGIGGLVTGVFMIAAVAQIVVGHLIDRYPLKRVFVGVTVLQIPMMMLAVFAADYAMLVVATGMMLLVFSGIPIYDTIVARYASGHWRSRIYALKYTLGLGVSAGTVPLVAWVRDETGGFGAVFWILAALAACIAFGALVFPSVAGRGAGELGRRRDTIPAALP